MAVALHYGLGTRRLTGMRMTADLKLGTNPALTVDWGTKSRIGLPSYGIVLRTGLTNTTVGWASDTHEKLFHAAVDGYLEDSRLRKGAVRVGVTAEMNPYEHRLGYMDYNLGWDWRSFWLSGFGTFKHDTFDDGYFPTRGIRLLVDGRYVFCGRAGGRSPTITGIKRGSIIPTMTSTTETSTTAARATPRASSSRPGRTMMPPVKAKAPARRFPTTG